MLKQSKTFFTHLVEFDAALLVFRGALGRTQLARGFNRAQPRAGVYPRAHQSVEQ